MPHASVHPAALHGAVKRSHHLDAKSISSQSSAFCLRRILRQYLFLLAATTLIVHLNLQAQSRRSLSSEYIRSSLADALSQRHLDTNLTLLAPVLATQENPTLDIRSVAPHDANRVRLRIQCHEAAACLPFYALAVCNPTGCPVSGSANIPAHATRPATAPVILRPGAHATLAFDDAITHIRLSVIALEPGPLGKRIRVTSFDRKHTWVAEITGPSTLKGSL